MQFDLQPVRAMLARLVQDHVALVTRSNRWSRPKKKPVALLTAPAPESARTRVTASSNDSITHATQVRMDQRLGGAAHVARRPAHAEHGADLCTFHQKKQLVGEQRWFARSGAQA